MPLFTRIKFNTCGSKWLYLPSSPLSVYNKYAKKTYYDVLKVPETCSTKDVRNAFISLSKENHPDRHQNDPSMHERFIRIKEAYSVLINPSSRRAYDLNLHQFKKKLEPPEERQFYHKSHARTTTQQKASKSSKTSYSSYSQGDPFTFHYNYQTQQKSERVKESPYYGVKGVKKLSNNRILSLLLMTAAVASIIQFFIIRYSALRSRELALERSRKNSLILAMAKEKAKLYGSEYQINLLKKSLRGSFADEDNPSSYNVGNPSNNKNNDVGDASSETENPPRQPPFGNIPRSPAATSGSGESCEKCNKCKRV